MAAPIHVGTGTVVAGTSVSASWPAGHAVGDLAFLTIAKNITGTFSTPSGWTLLFTDNPSNTTGSVRGMVFWKLAASTSEADVSLTDGNNILGCITVYRNVDQTTPVGTPQSVTSQSGTSLTVPAVTTTLTDSLIFVFGASERDAAGAHFSSVTNANLTDITIHANDGTTTGSGSGFMVASGAKASAGSTGTTAVVNITSSDRLAMQVVVNPMAVSGISGTTAGALSSTGTLVGAGNMSSADVSTLTSSATLVGYGAMLGNADGVLTIDSTLGATGSMTGSADAVLTVTGTGSALSASLLAAQISMALSVAGTLIATGSMSANAGAVLTTQGTLSGVWNMGGTAAASLLASGTLGQLNSLSGSATMALSVAAATLSGSYSLGGNSFPILSTSGSLIAAGRLVGTAAASLSATATGSRSGFIGGLASAQMTAVGTLRALTSPTISLNFRNKWLDVYSAKQALLNKINGITKLTLDSQSTAITSLQNTITHPTTGLAALSTAQTVLSSRVTLTENNITAQSASITALTASVADKASVSITNSLTARIDTIDSPYGINLLQNPGLATDLRNWGTVFWNQVSDPNWVMERNMLGVGYQVAGFNNFGFRHPATPAVGVFFTAGGDYVPAVAGYEYIASGKLAAVGMASTDLQIYFFNDALTVLGDATAAPNATGYVGGTSESNWVLSYVKTTAPAGTKWMRLGVRGLTSGAATPRAQVMKAMIERAAPGQTTPSAWNVGRLAAWAEWDLQFNVNGYISGIKLSSDGKTSDFVINADTFKVLKPGGGAGLTWNNGIIWTQGSTYSVMLGQDMTPSGDVIFWVGPNPVSPQLASKDDASIYFTETGDAVFRGIVNQSLLTGSALELGSTRIHTGGGRLAAFTVRDFGFKGEPSGTTNFSATITISDFQSPDVGEGYHFKRFSRLKADVVLRCDLHGNGSGGENVFIEVQYDGGAWTTIASRSGIDVDYKAGWSFLIRYTTLASWTTCAFRARTNNGNTMCLAFAVTVDNTYESGNTAGSWSGFDATAGGGGAAPPPPAPPGGGGGDGGEGYCLVADLAYLPDGTMVAANTVGTDFPCWNGFIENPGIEMHPLRAMPTGYEQAFIVETENGAAVPQSVSTPIPLRDGRLVTTLDCLGHEVLTNIDGVLAWSVVVAFKNLGVVQVVKPDLGDRVFFAGMDPRRTIATHNIRAKDSEP